MHSYMENQAPLTVAEKMRRDRIKQEQVRREAIRMHKRMKRAFKGIYSWDDRKILFKVGEGRRKQLEREANV